MDMITISAKTLDEAITKALLELQTTSDHLHYDVVQREKSGFLGFGAKPCIIRAKVMTEAEERAAKKEAAEKAAAEKQAAEKAALEKAASEKAAEEQKKKAPEEADSAKTEDAAAETETGWASEKRTYEKHEEMREFDRHGYSERKGYDRRRSDRRDSGRREKTDRPGRRGEFRTESTEETRVVREERQRQPVKADPEKVQAAAKDFLVSIFGAMGMEVSIATELNLENGELLVMMEGADMGILIGKRGQTLDSLQYLVSLVVNKETEGYLRVKLDTENYRERRKETLETLARNIAYKVKRTRRSVSLEPMNPYERRIIHSALQNDRYVVTRSEGEDPYRHVVISMKNDRYGSGGRRERYSRRYPERSYSRADLQENTAEEASSPAAIEVSEPQSQAADSVTSTEE